MQKLLCVFLFFVVGFSQDLAPSRRPPRDVLSVEKGEATLSLPVEAVRIRKFERRAAVTFPQAPVVLELNVYNDSRQVWATTVQPLPSGTALTPTMWWPEDSSRSLTLGTFTLNQDIAAGKSLLLPTFYREDFTPKGFVAWTLRVVTPDGSESMVQIDTIVHLYRTYAGVEAMLPHIDYSYEVVEEGNVWAVFRGKFAADLPTNAALEWLAVPADAIKVVSTSEVRINLSAVPWTELHLYQEFLAGICQNGWCDTRIHRRQMFPPGTYNMDPRP